MKVFLFLLLLTPQAMAYDFPTEWNQPTIKRTPSFCAVTERQVGYQIDAYYLPQNNSIYECYEDTDTKELKEESTYHEEAHAYKYQAMSPEASGKLDELYDKLKNYNQYTQDISKKWSTFEFQNDYSSKNADEWMAESARMVKFGQFKTNSLLDEKLKLLFEKMNVGIDG